MCNEGDGGTGKESKLLSMCKGIDKSRRTLEEIIKRDLMANDKQVQRMAPL